MVTGARGALREFTSRISSTEQRSVSRETLLLSALNLLPLLGLLTCAYYASHYAYWRPDTWAYLGSPHNEFEYNQRWLLPLFYHTLRFISPFTAWLIAVFLFCWLGYRVTRRYLAGSPNESVALSVGFAWLPAITPGFHSQLGWSSHAMSAIIVLVMMEALSRRLPRIPLVLIGTPFVYGLHQSFAPLTLLFLIPSYVHQSQQTLSENARDVAKDLVVWAISFALSWGLAETILYIAFGQIPAISNFRHAHSIDSIGTLVTNLVNNLAQLGADLGTVYSSLGVILILSFVLTLLAWRSGRTNSGGRPWIPMLVYSGALFASTYIFTAPVGVDLPIRITLIFGPATLVLGLALLGLIRRPVLTVLAIYAFCFYPFMVSITNNRWFAEYTTDVKSAIVEISAAKPIKVENVIVLGETGVNNRTDWPKDYSSLFNAFPQVFWPSLPTPAFYVSGFAKVVRCDGNGRALPGVCAELPSLTPQFARCATISVEICSAGATPDGYWLVRLQDKLPAQDAPSRDP